MPKALRIHGVGGPEVFVWEDVPVPEPGPGEARIRQAAIGLNYIDVYYRSGSYPLTEFPAVIGMEGAGVVEAVGPGVDHLSPGDRVAYASVQGAYAETRVIAADRLVVLPDAIGFEAAASVMLQGLTARYLLRQTYRVTSSDTILVHAAAGGTGLILCQWATALGARVIGVVSTEEKAALARAHGAETVLVGSDRLAERIRALTEGRMVPVVYDGVGRATFDASLDCLAPRGLLVSFGNASGPVTGVDLGILASKGSLYVTRPTLGTHVATRADLLEAAADLFAAIEAGHVDARASHTFPLSDAAEAHRALEARRTTGSIVLIP